MAALEVTKDAIEYDVGDLGEIEFDRWCSKAGVAANRSQRDRKGWDFIIELPASSPRYKHDELTAKVQVKATKSGAASARIKLDNLGRMATEPTPWFVVYFSFNDSGDVLSAHMVHVDEQFIANAHRVINAETPGTLHGTKIAVKWAAADVIDHNDPQALLNRIRDAIGDSMWSYCEAKARWNTSALTRRISGSLSFPGTAAQAYARLADLAVGIVDEIPAEITEMIDAATGASALPQGAVIETSAISIDDRTPESASIEAHFGSERIVLKCSMLTSGIFTAIPVEHHKLRLFTELFSVIIDADGVSMHVDVPSRAVSLSALGQTGRLLRILSNPGAKLTFRAADLSRTVEVQGHREGRSVDLRGAMAWEHAARIANHVGLPHDLDVIPSLAIVQQDQIASLETLINRGRTPARMIVDLHEQREETSGQAAVIVAPKIVLGDFVVVAIGVVKGFGKIRGGRLKIDNPTTTPIRVEWRARREVAKDFPEELFPEAMATLEQQAIPIIAVISKAPLAAASTQPEEFITSVRQSIRGELHDGLTVERVRVNPLMLEWIVGNSDVAYGKNGEVMIEGALLVPDPSQGFEDYGFGSVPLR